jgi:hypothetical protein
MKNRAALPLFRSVAALSFTALARGAAWLSSCGAEADVASAAAAIPSRVSGK